MPKTAFKIEEFEGGENKVKDPKDLELNESAKAFDVCFDKVGRIRLAGSGVAPDEPLASIFNSDSSNACYIEPGYGLFAFRHDYNMDSTPYEVDTDFLALAHHDPGVPHLQIGIVDSKSGASASASGSIVFDSDKINTLGNKTSHEITFFFADGALRFCDGKFSNGITSKWLGHVNKTIYSNLSGGSLSLGGATVNKWLEDNASLELGSSANSGRPYEAGATIVNASLQVYSDATSGGNGVDLDAYPSTKEEVRLDLKEETGKIFAMHTSTDLGPGAGYSLYTSATNTTTITLTTDPAELSVGDMIYLYGCDQGNSEGYNGQYELTSVDTGADTIGFILDSNDQSIRGDTDSVKVIKVEDMINPELKKSWIFGISFILDDGQETQIAKATWDKSSGDAQMDGDNAVDFRNYIAAPGMRFSYKHKVSTFEWHDRINGFRIYMKDIEGTDVEDSSQDWHLMSEADFNAGTYMLPGRDSVINDLLTVDDSADDKLSNTTDTATNTDAIKDIRFLSPITYHSLNGYHPTESITADYKTSVIANERCYIGNVSQGGSRFPDRIIKSPVGAYDVYPESFFLDSVFSDGDEIVKLVEFSDRILMFKKHSLYILNVTEEEEYLEEVLPSYGIEYPNQVVKTPKGVAFVNKSGVHLYSGDNEIITLTEGKREPWSFISHGKYAGFHFEHMKPSIGYDQVHKKIIVTRGGKAIDITAVDISSSGVASLQVEIQSGSIYVANSSAIPNYGDVFQISNTTDTSDSKLAAAKGKGLTANDCFVVTDNSNSNKASVQFIDPDTDVFIYDLNTDSISYRGIAYGSNNIGYDMTNYVYTHMLPYGGLILAKDAGGSTDNGANVDVVVWSDIPQTSTKLEYRTKVFDFGSPSQRKKIYKVYVTFKTHDDSYSGTGVPTYGASNVEVFYSVNHATIDHAHVSGDWTEFSTTSSTNYGGAGLIDDSGNDSPDWLTAVIKPTSSINNIYSFQLLFKANGTVPKGFEINDISIIYRMKPVK